MQVFYTPNIKKITYQLPEEESKHAIKVLRLEAGDEICMIDGIGGLYYGIIDDPDAKKCIIRVIEKIEQYNRRNYRLHIAIAPTKNIDRFEWFLEKATEIGIDEITPILCERSERKTIKTDRLFKIILSAMKQSIKAYRPKLNELTKFSDFLSANYKGNRFIAHCEDTPKPSFKSKLSNSQDFIVLIGPEGDFSAIEIEKAIELGYQEVHLGKSRLRTETAGIVACHSVNILKDE
ncbi:MAG: 16S rRNA (uracil(1498)-N(3))-methyltransferase [Salinivirgaceae bacterium]|jgi:16S rRNA (uracil1498-N3)-methyltransferase|nr:16S rRNA (uracil(1498)-N(3))-methyltransferase [Salinivirgaceae bacterium]